jgi:acyl carrier protein
LLTGATGDTEQLLVEFTSIVRDVTEHDVPPVRLDTQIADLGIESLIVFEVIDELERRFGVRFDEDELASMRTVGDLLRRATQLQ